MALKYHDDWQSSKKTVLQRNAYMFNNELMSDVSFTCGESRRIFHAHKYVLATSSAVFFAMFYGEIPPKEFPIRIEDAEEESFKEFLRFLYTDDSKITAEKVKSKDENVAGTYTSQKDSYGVPGYDVIIPKPISLLPNEEITIIATIKGPKSYYGKEGKLIVNVNDIFVTFEDASGLSSNGTSKTGGQFYKVFLSEL